MTHRLTILNLVVLLGVVGGVTLGLRWWLEWHVTTAYQQLVTNQEIVHAFSGTDQAAIERVAQVYNLHYQQIRDNHIAFSSGRGLPMPRIQPVRTVLVAGVLPVETSEALKALTPLRWFTGGQLYVGVPFFSDSLDQPGYIVYVKLWL